MRQFELEMRIAKLSPVTIDHRLAAVCRLRDWLPTQDSSLLDATPDDLRAYQARFVHLAPATIDIYSRHIKAFYDWAETRGFLDGPNPASGLIMPRLTRGRPHPTTIDDLRVVFACTTGPLRTAYVLAAFAGLRRGEICRLHRRDIDLAGTPTALIHGKGGKERVVPLLPPVVGEIQEAGLARGWVIHRGDGRPYDPERLSIESTTHLHGLGLQTTLHSMRHTFATHAARVTKDPLFVRDLMGHESVATTEIYMDSDLEGAHEKLAGYSAAINEVLGRPALRVVGG
jgi:integrase/recombinase XerC